MPLLEIGDSEIAIVALRPLLFFFFGVGVAILGKIIQTIGKNQTEYRKGGRLITGGTFLMWCAPFICCYGLLTFV
jgi:hypothetical protein